MIDIKLKKQGNIILISFVALSLSVYLGFDTLFGLTPPGIAKEIVTASFSAIFVIVLTMYLLNKQTELERESKQSERVFDEKVEIYKFILTKIEGVLKDGRISESELRIITFELIKLQMIGSDKVISHFTSIIALFNEVFQTSDDDIVEFSHNHFLQTYKSVSEFSNLCRIDLGISNHLLDEKVFGESLSTINESSETIRKKWQKVFVDDIDTWEKDYLVNRGFQPVALKAIKKLRNIALSVSEELNIDTSIKYSGMINYYKPNQRKSFLASWPAKRGSVTFSINVPIDIVNKQFPIVKAKVDRKKDFSLITISSYEELEMINNDIVRLVKLAMK